MYRTHPKDASYPTDALNASDGRIGKPSRQASDKPSDKPAINRRTDMREIFSVIAQDFIIYYCDEFIIFVYLMLLIDTD